MLHNQNPWIWKNCFTKNAQREDDTETNKIIERLQQGPKDTMRHFTTILFTLMFMSLATPGHCGSLLEYPFYLKWYKQQVAAIKSTFDCIVPQEERSQWRFYDHYIIVPKPNGDIGETVKCFWIPPNDSNFFIFNGEDRNWPHRIVIRFMQKEQFDHYLEKKQSNIDAFKATIKDLYADISSRVINQNIIKSENNDTTVYVETERIENDRNDIALVNHEAIKEIAIFTICGERVISLSYELRPKFDKGLADAWENTKNSWLRRFEDIQFE